MKIEFFTHPVTVVHWNKEWRTGLAIAKVADRNFPLFLSFFSIDHELHFTWLYEIEYLKKPRFFEPALCLVLKLDSFHFVWF